MKRQYEVLSKLTKSSGIYIITCNLTDKVYIGETINLSQRIQKHFSLLRKGKHLNPILQNMFNKYSEKEFKVDILEYVDSIDELYLKTLEQNYQKQYPNCISLDSNEIFQIERSEEWKLKQKEQLNNIRKKSIEACTIPVIIYDLKTKNYQKFTSILEASKVIEYKHLHKNLYENNLTPYNFKVGFFAKTFKKEMIDSIVQTKNQITVFKGDYSLYNLLNGKSLHFGSKIQFSLNFSESRNDFLYDNYTNKIDWEFNSTKVYSEDELWNVDLEIFKTKYKFSSICNLKLWYESLLIFKNNSDLQKLTGVNRKKLGLIFKQRTAVEWITLIETVIARVKSV